MQRSYRKLVTTCLLVSSFFILSGIGPCVPPENIPPECGSVDRYLDYGDGTVIDCQTGLLWLKDANCFEKQSWSTAQSSALALNSGECGLSDGSSSGDWRLPTKVELQSIGSDPPSTWESGFPSASWTIPGVPFVNVQSNYYWASGVSNTNDEWFVLMHLGYTTNQDKDVDGYYVWPVHSDN